MRDHPTTASSPAPEGVLGWSAGGRGAVAVLVAVAAVLAVEGLVRLLVGGAPPPLRFPDHQAAVRAELMASQGDVDVVFAGTSMAWQGFVPSRFSATDPHGRSTFNAGLDGAVPVVTGPWLVDHVVPALHPDTVVWGLSTLDLSPSFGQAPLAAWESAPEGRPGVLGEVERTLAGVSEVIARRAQLRRPADLVGDGATAARAAAAKARREVDADGWRQVPAASRTSERAAVQRTRLADWTPDRADLDAIVETVVSLRAEGVEVVLAELPVPPSFVALHPRGTADVQRARATLAQVAEVLGVRLVPAGGGWTDTDFEDFTHLTAEAAGRFTATVARALPTLVASTAADGAGSVSEVTAPTPTAETAQDPTAQEGLFTTPPAVAVPAPPPPAVASAPTPASATTAPTGSAPPTGSASPPPPAPTQPATAMPAQTVPAQAEPTAADTPPPSSETSPTASPTPPPPPPPPAAPSVPVEEWLAGDEALAVATLLRTAAIDQVGCAGAGIPGDLARRSREGVRHLADQQLAGAVHDLVDAAGALAASCGSEASWATAMRQTLAAVEAVAIPLERHHGVDVTPAGRTGDQAASAGPAQLAAWAGQAYERLEWLLDGAILPRLARNDVWWSYAQRGHVDTLRQLAQGGQEIDAVVLGTSQAHTGVLADRLSASTGSAAFNAFIDGGTIDVGRQWVERFVLEVAAPEQAVVVVSGIDLLSPSGGACSTRVVEDFVASLDRASAAFSSVPWLAGHDPLDLASSADPAPLTSPLVPAYGPDPSIDYRQRSREEMFAAGRPYLSAYEHNRLCADRMGDLRSLLAGLRDRGIQATVAMAPIHSALREVAPAGAVADLDRQVEQVAADTGAGFLSATELLEDHHLVDLVHVTQEGAEIFTDRIVEVMRAPLAGVLGAS